MSYVYTVPDGQLLAGDPAVRRARHFPGHHVRDVGERHAAHGRRLCVAEPRARRRTWFRAVDHRLVVHAVSLGADLRQHPGRPVLLSARLHARLDRRRHVLHQQDRHLRLLPDRARLREHRRHDGHGDLRADPEDLLLDRPRRAWRSSAACCSSTARATSRTPSTARRRACSAPRPTPTRARSTPRARPSAARASARSTFGPLLLLLPWLAFYLLWPNWGATLYGEVRGAKDIRKPFWSMFWGLWVTVAMVAVVVLLINKTIGWNFYQSANAAYWNNLFAVSGRRRAAGADLALPGDVRRLPGRQPPVPGAADHRHGPVVLRLGRNAVPVLDPRHLRRGLRPRAAVMGGQHLGQAARAVRLARS